MSCADKLRSSLDDAAKEHDKKLPGQVQDVLKDVNLLGPDGICVFCVV